MSDDHCLFVQSTSDVHPLVSQAPPLSVLKYFKDLPADEREALFRMAKPTAEPKGNAKVGRGAEGQRGRSGQKTLSHANCQHCHSSGAPPNEPLVT